MQESDGTTLKLSTKTRADNGSYSAMFKDGETGNAYILIPVIGIIVGVFMTLLFKKQVLKDQQLWKFN